MAKKQQQFFVYVKVTLDTEICVSADNFEEALAKAKEYKITDIVSFDSSHNDSSVEITGVHKPNV